MSADTTLSSVPKVLLFQLEELIKQAHIQKALIRDFLASPLLGKENLAKNSYLGFVDYLKSWNRRTLTMCSDIIVLELQNAQEKSSTK